MQALYQLSASAAPQAFQSPGQPPFNLATMKQFMQAGVSPVLLQQIQVAQQQQIAAASAGYFIRCFSLLFYKMVKMSFRICVEDC